MAPKKVKIVDIPNLDEEEIPLIEDDKEEIVEEPTEEVEEVEQPTKKVHKFNRKSGPQILAKDRVDELVSCQKCGKMVLAKTLNYSHLKSCAKHSEDFIPVREQNSIKKIKANIPEEVPKTTLVPTQPTVTSLSKPILPQASFQDMRREHNRKRITEKSDAMKQLFRNAI